MIVQVSTSTSSISLTVQDRDIVAVEDYWEIWEIVC